MFCDPEAIPTENGLGSPEGHVMVQNLLLVSKLLGACGQPPPFTPPPPWVALAAFLHTEHKIYISRACTKNTIETTFFTSYYVPKPMA